MLKADILEGGRLSSDRKSTRLNSSHTVISYAVFCLKKKKKRKIEGRALQMAPSKGYEPATITDKPKAACCVNTHHTRPATSDRATTSTTARGPHWL